MHEASGLLAGDNIPHSVTRQDKEVIFRLDNDLKTRPNGAAIVIELEDGIPR